MSLQEFQKTDNSALLYASWLIILKLKKKKKTFPKAQVFPLCNWCFLKNFLFREILPSSWCRNGKYCYQNFFFRGCRMFSRILVREFSTLRLFFSFSSLSILLSFSLCLCFFFSLSRVHTHTRRIVPQYATELRSSKLGFFFLLFFLPLSLSRSYSFSLWSRERTVSKCSLWGSMYRRTAWPKSHTRSLQPARLWLCFVFIWPLIVPRWWWWWWYVQRLLDARSSVESSSSVDMQVVPSNFHLHFS